MKENIDDVIRMLDNMTEKEISRMKIETSGEVREGETERTYHHGRCDVGSPFATGKLFDLEPPECGN
ncbi:MAG: hypothetical protein HDR20_12620 [Lachnospiraceae bacterium]|nr:hypothetical protein [Lachnospiraceae bacterium]